MKVDFFSFDDAPQNLKMEWQKAISEVLDSGRYIGGDWVSKFEQEWAEYLGVRHCIGVGNGLDAISLSLKALSIGPGSVVAVPSHTFIATWLAVSAVGATPVGIDCDEFGLMDLGILENLRVNIDAVIPVHMHGQMVDMKRLSEWAQKNNVFVVEDCAQAHGASQLGKPAGTWGDLGAFSFYPTKNLGAVGDAGAVVSNDYRYAEKVRSISNYGTVPGNKYEYLFEGVNSRLDPIQASVLSINLKNLNGWNFRRFEIAERYTAACRNANIKTLVDDLHQSVWHHFVVIPENREVFRMHMDKSGVSTEIHYPSSAEDIFSAISNYSNSNPKNSRRLAEHIVSLPISPWMDEVQVNHVIDSLIAFNAK